MHRSSKTDAELDRLNEERDDLAIRVSLAWDADPPDLPKLSQLQRELAAIEVKIARHPRSDQR